MGWVEVERAELELPGGLSVENAKRATGALDLRGDLDLSQGAALFANERIERISGHVALSARVERLDAKLLSDRVRERADARARRHAERRTVRRRTSVGSMPASTSATTAPRTRPSSRSSPGTRRASSRAPMPRPTCRSSAGRRARRPSIATRSTALEVGGVVDVDRRDVSELPGIFARPDLRGALSLHATIAGSIAKPSVTLVARAEGLAEKEKQTGRAQATLRADRRPAPGALGRERRGRDRDRRREPRPSACAPSSTRPATCAVS